MKPVRLLGIDPGYGRCGWGVIDLAGNQLRHCASGVIETPKTDELPRRLAALHAGLRRVIAEYAPDETAVEELFFAKNVKTAIQVGQARGVVVLTCAEAGLPVAEYKPAEIKQAVSGYGAATKPQIERMVCVLLALAAPPALDDATDALAVAICHAHCRRMKNLAARERRP